MRILSHHNDAGEQVHDEQLGMQHLAFTVDRACIPMLVSWLSRAHMKIVQ